MADSAKKPDLATYGVSGLNMMMGVPQDEWHPQLIGHLWPKIVREMVDSCPIIGAGLRFITMTARKAKWSVVAADENDVSAREQAVFLDSCLKDMTHTLDSFMARSDAMLPFGYAVFEECFKFRRGEKGAPSSLYDDGRIGWSKFAFRSPESRERWEVLPDGTITAFIQTDAWGRQIRIPYEKLLHFVLDEGKDNPEGRSWLRNAWVDYRHRKYTQQFEGVGLQKDTAGMLDIQVPLEVMIATSGNELLTKQALEETGRNASVGHQSFLMRPSETDSSGHPTGYVVKQIQSGGGKMFDTDKIIRRCDQRIALVLNTEVQQLGQGSAGANRALADNKTSMLGLALLAILGCKRDVMNRRAIPKLMRLNGWNDPAKWPRLEHGDIEVPDPEAFMTAMEKAVGTFPRLGADPKVENRARQVLGVPERTKEEIEQDDHEGDGRPVDTVGKIPLGIQQLANARTDALAAGDEALATKLGLKIDEMLAKI